MIHQMVNCEILNRYKHKYIYGDILLSVQVIVVHEKQ